MFVIMQFLKSVSLVFLVFLFLGTSKPSETVSCREIIEKMLDSVRVIKTQRFDVKATERVNGGFLFAESRVKLHNSPKKIYLNNPHKGLEILWVEGANKGNATVRTRTIPFVNLDLDPYGSLMRKDQHHTIFELGSQYIGVTFANTILRAPKDFDKHFKFAGSLKWNNIDCYQIMIDFPEYKYIEYTVSKGETVTSISHKLSTSDYKIRFKNELSSYFGTIKEGKKLMIPIPYSNKVIVYIDKKTFIPINLKVYDEEGLFEEYEFFNMQINIPFASNEFSKEFKGYGF